MKRRDFLKTAGATTALGLLAGCREREVVYLAQSVKRQTVRDGWRPWVCSQCAGGCGAQVRVAGAEAKKIEGAKADPSSRGGLCALGQSTLQEHYDPDRPRSPKLGGQEASWDDAMSRTTELLAECESPEDLLILTANDPVLAVLANRVARSLGAKGAFALADDASLLEAEAAERLFGRSGVPAYDLTGADLIVTFGADVLDSGRNPVYFARQLADRDGETLHIHVGPRMSLTAANADLWLAPRPGTLGILAHAIGRALAGGESAPNSAESVAALGEVAETCDVAPARVQRLVAQLAAAERAVVVSGAEGCGSDAVADVAAILDLNRILGAVEGGRMTPRGGSVMVPEGWLEEGLEVAGGAALLDRLSRAKVAILVDVEPQFFLPSDAELVGALERLSGTVVVAAESNPSAELADVVLPGHSSIERLQAVVSEPAGNSVSLSAPVVPPLWESRHPGDLLLALGAAGGETLFKSFDDYLVDLLGSNLGDDPASRKRAFRKALGERLDLTPAASSKETSTAGPSLELSASSSVTPAASGTLSLLAFSSVKHREGRGFNRPWLQELPDPMSTVMWQGWAQISEVDAAEAGVSTGDWVRLSADGRSVDLPAVVLPFVRPGLVEVPRGYGVGSGRFAGAGRGSVLDLAAGQPVGSRGAILLQADVTLERLSGADLSPVAIYGRGLRQDEHLPRGWGSHETKGGSASSQHASSQHASNSQVVPLRTPSTNDDSGASS